jgi:hypothetical protein
MDVDAALARGLEESGRQQQAIGGHDHCVGADGAQPFDQRLLAQARRLQHLESVLERQTLHRRCDAALPAASGPVGLRQYEGDAMAGLEEPRERLRGEGRRAGEN